MKLAMLFLAAFALCLLLPASVNVASAHGGSYRGPSGEVPPGQRDPKDPQPPPDDPVTPDPGLDGGPESPNPDNPSPGPDGNPPDSPPPSPGPEQRPGGNGLNGGTQTPRRRAARRVMSFTNWLFWWAYNKDEILGLKARLKAQEHRVATSNPMHHLGRGRGLTARPGATPEMIETKIVPALLAVIDNKDIHEDIRGGALIALARAEPTKKHLDRFFLVASADSGEHNLVKESAIIALGILQVKDVEVREFLLELVSNRNYPMRGRCFAMLSLGLLKDKHEDVHKALEARLDGSEVHLDVPICALLAMGLIGDEAKVPQMVSWLESGRIGRNKLSDLESAWVVTALGKIGDEGALKAIQKTLRGKGRYTRRSAVIALGQIAPQTEKKEQIRIAKLLARFHAEEGDLTAKNFAMISLGRIGGNANAAPELRDSVKSYLKNSFRDSSRTTQRPFVALAMGLLGLDTDANARKPQALKEELSEILRTDLVAMKGDKVALGAQAVALGMIGDRKSIKLLTGILEDREMEKKLRGAAAIALGLIGERSANDAILKTLREREDRSLRVDTAVAAGLLGDSRAVDELVQVLLHRRSSQFVLGSVALALGQVGDHRAIDPMLAILEPGKANGSYPDLTRALVAVALGQLADRRDFRVLSRLSRDINYRANVPSLDEILTIL